YDHFDLYSRISLLLPLRAHVSNSKRLTHVRATPVQPRRGTRKPVAQRFDTALIIEDKIQFESEGGFAGLRPAQIRVIFRLPQHLGHCPHPLVYVQWFRPLRGPDPTTGFHITSHSTRNHRSRVRHHQR
ncbi:hypothetical protein A0H81_12304, partial [Grifola frondosa]